jgi:soluble cytochrome b562
MIPYIRALAEQVCIETDPEKLTTLLDELCREIDSKEATLHQGKIDCAQESIEHLC